MSVCVSINGERVKKREDVWDEERLKFGNVRELLEELIRRDVKEGSIRTCVNCGSPYLSHHSYRDESLCIVCSAKRKSNTNQMLYRKNSKRRKELRGDAERGEQGWVLGEVWEWL